MPAPQSHPRRRGELHPALSPATREVLGYWTETPPTRVPELYRRARDAFAEWGRTTPEQRVPLLRRLRLAVVEHLDRLTETVAASTGKPPAEALTTELLPLLDTLVYLEKHAPEILRRRRMPTPIFLLGKTSYVEYRPRGVVLVISPWNYPFQLAMVPVVTALAAGNAVVLKPSEMTPLVGVAMEELFERAGVPADLVQTAHGDGRLGAALVEGRPDYVFFTGSYRTGKQIQREAAKHLIPTTLELSGHDAMIVLDDAPLERAVRAALWGGLLNSGQTCVAVERLYVQRGVYEQFISRLAEEAARLRQGPRSDADLGAMTTERQAEIVREHVADALAKGATLLYGEPPERWDGGFIPPVILTGVTDDMLVCREETFGPVLAVVPVGNGEEAVELANASPYGLSASVWTVDRRRAERLASLLDTGSVVINDVLITIANPHLPFGGVKRSGLGSYHGEAGLKAFSCEKAVMAERLLRPREVHWFPYAGKAPLFADLLRAYFGESRRWLRFFRAYFQLLRASR